MLQSFENFENKESYESTEIQNYAILEMNEIQHNIDLKKLNIYN